MIKIGKAFLTVDNGKARLSAMVSLPQGETELFYETDEEYGKWFVSDVADPFVIAVMLPALVAGEDIQVECISDRLYHNFKTIMYLLGKAFGYSPIGICAQSVVSPDYRAEGVGTGFSGGVDSFATYVNHTSASCPASMRITHLALFNVGAYGNDLEKTQEAFLSDLERARNFAQEVNMPLIPLNSNLSSIYIHKDIYHYSLRTTLCISSAIMSLQKLFSLYYISSSNTIEDCKLSAYDQYWYEGLLVQLLSTKNTEILIAEHDLNRVEKTLLLLDNPYAQKHLYVCAAPIMNEKHGKNYKNDTSPNCCECPKCIRTLLAIDIAGKLDAFAERFDIEKWKSIRDREIALMYLNRNGNHFVAENWELFNRSGHSLTACQQKLVKQIYSDWYPSLYRVLKRRARRFLQKVGVWK